MFIYNEFNPWSQFFYRSSSFVLDIHNLQFNLSGVFGDLWGRPEFPHVLAPADRCILQLQLDFQAGCLASESTKSAF